MGVFAPELKGFAAEFTVKRGRGSSFRRNFKGCAIGLRTSVWKRLATCRMGFHGVWAATPAFQSDDCVETAQLQDYFPHALY